MDSIKINIFYGIIFVSTTINSISRLLLYDNEQEETLHLANISKIRNRAKINFLDRMKERIELFLEKRKQKSSYLIWLIFDCLLASYFLVNFIMYGFCDKNLISKFERHNLIMDYYRSYRLSRMANRISAIVLIETYLLRIRNSRRCMSEKYYQKHHHERIQQTIAYFARLKLTLRAWLYILGLTDAVESRDKVYFKESRSSSQGSSCELVQGDKVRCKVSEASNNYHHIIMPDKKAKQRSQSLANLSYNRYNHMHGIFSDVKFANTLDMNLGATNPSVNQLFVFNDDFREINYQLKFPKKPGKNGPFHILDMVTLRLLTYIIMGSLSITTISTLISVYYSVSIELIVCNNSWIVFVEKRLFHYVLLGTVLTHCALILVDIVVFILGCFVCYNKMEHTIEFIEKVVRLHASHNQSEKISTLNVHCTNIATEKTSNKRHLSIGQVRNFIDFKENKREKTTENRFLRHHINKIGVNKIDSIDLSRDIDKLIRMMIELRRNLDELKRHFTIYFHMELVFKMPCIMMTIATIIKVRDLDYLHLNGIMFLSINYWLPIILSYFGAALIHNKVMISQLYLTKNSLLSYYNCHHYNS